MVSVQGSMRTSDVRQGCGSRAGLPCPCVASSLLLGMLADLLSFICLPGQYAGGSTGSCRGSSAARFDPCCFCLGLLGLGSWEISWRGRNPTRIRNAYLGGAGSSQDLSIYFILSHCVLFLWHLVLVPQTLSPCTPNVKDGPLGTGMPKMIPPRSGSSLLNSIFLLSHMLSLLIG